MKKIETYLFFDGNCGEAMHFYEQVLQGSLRLVKVNETPAAGQFPPDSGDKIIHSRLDADGAVLMASDWMAEGPCPARAGFSVTLSAPDAESAKALFDKLADGGQIRMPFQGTFWSDGFGEILDRFGTPWMVMSEASPQ